MLIDLLSQTLERSGALENFWGKLDAGADATIGVASSARPFLVAARFAERPQPTLVVVPGEETAETFARMLGAYVGDEKVYLYREREENPFILDPPANAKEYQARARQSARRLEALWALQSGRSCLVVASARALLRKVAPARAEVARPLVLEAGKELDEMGISGVEDYEGLVERLVELGYENTGKLDGPGTFSAHGGTIDVFAGNLVNPVRLDFFGDELEEIRSLLPGTLRARRSRSFPCANFLSLRAVSLRRVRGWCRSRAPRRSIATCSMRSNRPRYSRRRRSCPMCSKSLIPWAITFRMMLLRWWSSLEVWSMMRFTIAMSS